jgi:cell division protein FtsI (penicillin-binding protein 3)
VNPSFKTRRARIGTLTLVIGALFGLAAIRLAVLALIDGPRLAAIARNEHQGEIDLAAVRGAIVDRNGKPLALSAATMSIYARPRHLLQNSTRKQRARLAALVGLQPQALERRLEHGRSFIWLARHQSLHDASAFDELGLKGLGSAPEYGRFYPESSLAAAVVGKAGADGQGLSGVELEYDHLVRGEASVLHFDHDALGRPIFDSPIEMHNPQSGARLQLTIDATIQTQAEGYLANQVAAAGAQGGTAIVLDPFSGEVLALANVTPEQPVDSARLHNAGVQDAFEPGSTLKGLVGAIALDDRVADTQRKFYCEKGVWRVTGKLIHDDSPRGWLDLGSIIEVSSNICAAKIALALGAARLSAGLEAFGIGRKTGIDLPGEASGLLRPAASWRQIELADHGFGQGLAVTPIQLATAYAAIANGGVVMRPYVLKAAYDAEGRELLRHTPQVLRRAVSPETAHAMNLLLRGVVDGREGTGRLAQVADFTVAGKTGTAQMVNQATGAYYQRRLVASFVGFVPARDPRLVILVVLYDVAHGHFGGLVAAPVFSAIAVGALQQLEVPPERVSMTAASLLPFGGSESADSAATGEQVDSAVAGVENQDRTPAAWAEAAPPRGGLTPNFLGLSLRKALCLARAEALNPDVEGAGYVVAQAPAPGATRASSLNLRLSSETAAWSDRAPSRRADAAPPGPQQRRRRID